jgi:hypothetical protein
LIKIKSVKIRTKVTVKVFLSLYKTPSGGSDFYRIVD